MGVGVVLLELEVAFVVEHAVEHERGVAVGASATARAFLEAQLRQQHNMAQDLEEEQTKHKSRGHGMSL